jgi:biofilm PGA synthesis N-glycosyltransferase PgaC
MRKTRVYRSRVMTATAAAPTPRRTSTRRLTYALVTPARDEEQNLRRLAASLLAQTVPPQAWIVVDDGSADRTPDLMRELAQEHDWISVISAPADAGRLVDGRLTGRDVAAFQAGLAALAAEPDIVLKLDADVALLPDFFAGLLSAFEDDPRLGIAGGACFEFEDGAWRERWVTGNHVRGATRAYRWACLQEVRPLEPRLGWDGIDEVRAAVNGWHTKSFRALPFFHYRLMGERDGVRRSFRDQGSTAHYMGYRPSYLVARALFRMRTTPAALAMITGYVGAALRREPGVADPAVRKYIRDRQRLRELPKRAAEALGRGSG